MSLTIPHSEAYQSKLLSADAAARLIKSGQHVFVGTACATPQTLLKALEQLPQPPADIELVHFITTNAPQVGNQIFRHRTFFVGSDIKESVKQGRAEYVPIPISMVPSLFTSGRLSLDVALIQVSAPDSFGYVSLGVSVDVVAAAVQSAKKVIAEVNPNMPWTMGDSAIHLSQIDHLVEVDTPMIEYRHVPAQEEVVDRIARYIAGVIEDGSTLQIGLGRIPNEALKYLEDRRDLGIHSDVITEAILPLLEKGIVNGRQKTDHKFKVVTSFALGSQKLYDVIDRNPLFSFQPIEVVCHPHTVATQNKMVSLTQAFALDLTGQVCSDQFNGEFYGGLSAQADFMRGASRSPGGKPIICLMSTTDDGETSRIRPQLLAGEGVSVARSDVHYVITEYGMAYLFGKSIRERAMALIELAHPKFRSWLLDEAKKLGYLPHNQSLQNLRPYPIEDERRITLKNGAQVMVRPARASDANGIRNLFFKLPAEDIYTRFFRRVQALSDHEIQRLCNYSYENEVGFVAVIGPRENEVIIGQACYFLNPSSNLAESAFLVDPAWQGSGLGSALQQRLVEHGKSRGLRGLIAEILPQNAKMIALAKRCSESIHIERDEDGLHVTMLFV